MNMAHFTVHTIDTAPTASRSSLEALQRAFGFVPNMAGAMATSPVLIDSLVGLFGTVHSGSFSESQIQTLLLTNAVTNAAEWAAAFHSRLALDQDISSADVEAMRSGRSPADPKLAALSTLARTLITTRGHVNEQNKSDFLAAGYEPEHLLEVIAVVAASTITNYTSSVTQPPLEEMIVPHAWRATNG
jgi:alkylhydroperoxidase family enzyme